jgi:benzoate-CoA ligase
MYEKTSNPFNDKIYGKDWHAWRDPDLPESVNPIQLLLDRHLDSPLQAKPAVIVDNVATSYRELAQLVRRASANLAAADLRPGERLLLFGTDSLDYVVTWLAAIHIGVVPAVVSDLHKSKDLCISFAIPPHALCSSMSSISKNCLKPRPGSPPA